METDGGSSLVPAEGQGAALERALSVAEQIARVVDSLEEAVDDLLDPARQGTESTEDASGDTTAQTE